jgi:hypothetical protein
MSMLRAEIMSILRAACIRLKRVMGDEAAALYGSGANTASTGVTGCFMAARH